MGRKARQRPERLGGKLRVIREALGLSQTGMVKRLEDEGIAASQISEYESGKREPSLITLLQYARLANVYLDALVDDELDLPAKLPSAKKHGGLTHR
ncbi:MAG TPA: helix-turn-helix transcriptional regulator [Pyrinomonadaceae bacterium]|jgi:transcriptional regulator with XRE-family HTH domain|nr:helix-turn-helix transcriptional regulator [Pyrinomonadaceae bacterium]